MSAPEVVTLRLVNEAHVTHKKKSVRLAVYDVLADGEAVGTVARKMLTRERKIPGRRYVEARWQSPGWVSRSKDSRLLRELECASRRDGIQRVLRDQLGLSWSDAEKLAAAVKVVG